MTKNKIKLNLTKQVSIKFQGYGPVMFSTLACILNPGQSHVINMSLIERKRTGKQKQAQ